MTDTIYAFWDAQQIQYILNGVAMMSAMPDYLGLIKVFAILGLFVAVGASFAKARGEDAFSYIIILAIFYFALFLPKRDVVIQDTATASGTYTVSNVPLGLAVFSGAESHIGYWLTKTMETVFSLPNDIQFQKTGFMFASRAITERMKMRFYNKNINDSLQNLTKDCIYPEMAVDSALYKQVMENDDMWGSLGPAMNPGRMTTVYNDVVGEFKTVGCKDAYNLLTHQINAHVTNDLFPKLASRLNPNVTPAIAKTLLAAQLPASDQYITNTNRAAADGIMQAAMMNLLEDSLVFVPQMIGDATSAQVAQAAAVARSSSYISYRAMAKMAEDSLPVLRNAVHIVILALFPIVMLLIVMGGVGLGGKILKVYLMALFWVNLWAPIYAVLNFFMTWYTVGGATAATLGMDTLVPGNGVALTHALMADQSVAGMLALSVPVIAYQLTSVSAASMTSVVSGIMAPSNSAAQSSSNAAATGQTSLGNVTMYQANTARTNRHGAAIDQSVGSNGDVRSTYDNGSSTIAQPMNAFRVGAMTSSGSAASLSTQAEKARTAAMSHTREAGKAEEALLNIARSHNSGLTTSNSSGDGGTLARGGDYSGAVTEGAGQQDQAGHGATYNTSDKATETWDFRAGAKGSLGRIGNQTMTEGGNGGSTQTANPKTSKSASARIGVDAGGGVDLAEQYAAGITKDSKTSHNASQSQGTEAKQAFVERLISDAGFRHTVMGSDADSSTVQALISSRRMHLDRAQALTSQAESLRQQASQAESSGMQVSYDPLKSPDNTELGLSVTRQVEQAPHDQGTDRGAFIMRQSGYTQGTYLPDTYADGSHVKGSQKELDALGTALMNDPAVSDQTKAAYRAYLAKVPNSGAAVGASSPAANENNGLAAKAENYYEASKDKHDHNSGVHHDAHVQERTRYQVETGDGNPNSSSPIGLNKLLDTADDIFLENVITSGQQALPNSVFGHKVPGAKPTLEQYQKEIGYEPGKDGGGKK